MQLTILDILLKATIVLAIAAAAAAALRRASASVRHLVWTLGMLGALGVAVLTFAVPRWELPILRVQPFASPAAAPDGGQTPAAAFPGSDLGRSITYSDAGQTPAAAVPGSDPGRSVTHLRQLAFTPAAWTTLLLATWAAGAILIISRVLLGLIAVQWMARRTPSVTDAPWLPLARELASELGLRRVRFLRSAHASMPMAWGLFRPSVLMPADADAWPADRLRIVLLHELAHVKRRDCLTHVFAQMAFAAYWFNPLAWVAARHMRMERERACDDLVLAAGTRGSEYADQLLDIARVMRAGRFPAVLAGASLAMAHRSQLEGRLMAILDPTVPRRALSRVRAGLVVAAFAGLVVPVAAIQPWTEDGQSAGTAQSASAAPTVQTNAAGKQVAHVEKRTVVVQRGHHVPPQGVAGGIAEGVSGGIAKGVAGGIGEGVADGVAEAVTEGVVGGVTGGIASAIDTIQGEPKPAGQERDRDTRSGAQRDARAIDALIQALNDSDKDVRETAMAALARVRDPRVFDPLVAALRDTSADIRAQAVFGLGQLRDKRAIAPLTQALKDQNGDVRQQAAFALGQLRSADAIDGLTLALRDSDKDVRQQAAFALGQIRDARAVDPLTSALKDAAADVRQQAAFALGQIRDAKAVEALVIALKDATPDVRQQAAFALGQLRDPRAIDGLTLALKDPNASVRQQAAFALGQIRD